MCCCGLDVQSGGRDTDKHAYKLCMLSMHSNFVHIHDRKLINCYLVNGPVMYTYISQVLVHKSTTAERTETVLKKKNCIYRMVHIKFSVNITTL